MRSTLAALLVVTALFAPAAPAVAADGPADCVDRQYSDAVGDAPALDAVAYATQTCGGWDNSTVRFSVRAAGDWGNEELGEFTVMVSDGRPGSGCAARDDLDALITAYYDRETGGLEIAGAQFATCDDELGVFAAVERTGSDSIALTVAGSTLGRAPHVRFSATLTARAAGDSSGDRMPEPSEELPSADRFVGPAASYGGGARPTLDACPPGLVDPAAFTDVTRNVHAGAIDCVAWWGVAKGVVATSYEPAGAVTRGQMATFLTRVIDASEASLPVEAVDRFADDAGSAHEPAINRLAAADIVNGYADARYGVHDPVSRAQMATFLMRAYEYVAGTGVDVGRDQFDDDADSVHEPAINQAAAAGIAAGVTSRRFAPGSAVRRDQMASFVARLLDLLTADGWARSPLLSGIG